MKRYALAAVAAFALLGTATTTAKTHTNSQSTPPPLHCTIEGFRPFSKTVWRLEAWERGMPPQRILETRTEALACATAPHRQAMKRTWRRHSDRFFEYRDRRLITPFFYAGHWWAVPYPIALCESGGNYYVGPSGAYGLIPPFPQYMAPAEQDRVAHQLYLEMGEAPWAPYEGGCYLR